jgi:hypothetical protein
MADDTAPQDRSRSDAGGRNRAAEAEIKEAFQSESTPASRRVEPLPNGVKPDQLAGDLGLAEDRQEALIDESLDESFPASDPPSAKRIT